MKRKRQGECALCGKMAYLTKEHIPPRCLFPKPRPTGLQLITVPCCSECNNGTTEEDEYFKVTVSLRVGARDFLSARLFDSTKKTVCKNRKFFSEIFDSEQPIFTPSGIYTGYSAVSRSEGPTRLVARKIISGLFYHHFGKPVPTSHVTVVQLTSDIPREQDQFMSDWIQGVAQFLECHAVGSGGIFRYGFTTASEDGDTTVWFLSFYGQMALFGYTMPRRMAEQAVPPKSDRAGG